MATTQKAAAPKAAKKSSGFTGIRGAFWIIVFCFVAALCIYNLWLGSGSNFQGGDNANAPLNIFGTIYKGGYVVPIIHTLLLTVQLSTRISLVSRHSSLLQLILQRLFVRLLLLLTP